LLVLMLVLQVAVRVAAAAALTGLFLFCCCCCCCRCWVLACCSRQLTFAGLVCSGPPLASGLIRNQLCCAPSWQRYYYLLLTHDTWPRWLTMTITYDLMTHDLGHMTGTWHITCDPHDHDQLYDT
jgi:hypothetical protein